MHYYDYEKSPSTFSAPFLLFAMLFSGTCHGFTVNHATLNADETGYTLTADIAFQLSEEVKKALKHGVALRIDIEIEARQSRRWLWDRMVRMEVLKQRLEYHPLNEQYLVTDLNAGIKRRFQNLTHALTFLGTIKNYPAFRRIAHVARTRYIARLRARLNTSSLPTPLKLFTYTSTDWRLSSPWFTWAFNP